MTSKEKIESILRVYSKYISYIRKIECLRYKYKLYLMEKLVTD